MKEEFTTYSLAKAFGWDYQAVRTWVDGQYVVPSKPAAGRGTKAKWVRDDVYSLVLFKYLLDRGFNRKKARDIIRSIWFAESSGEWLTLKLLREVAKSNDSQDKQKLVNEFLDDVKKITNDKDAEKMKKLSSDWIAFCRKEDVIIALSAGENICDLTVLAGSDLSISPDKLDHQYAFDDVFIVNFKKNMRYNQSVIKLLETQ